MEVFTPSRRTFWIVAACGALLYLFTAITNPGIIAADDYGDVISRVIPAESHSVQEIGEKAGIRSPFTPLTHLAIVKAAHALGVTHPLAQFRVDLAVVGLFSFFVILWSGWTMFAGFSEPERMRLRTVFAALLGFYFLAPLMLTRPMVEAMSAPFLAASVAMACRYQQTASRWWLAGSIVVLAIGAMHRPQIGVCAFGLLVLVIWLRRWADLAVLAVVGGLCAVASGMLDYALIGQWHATLRRYVAINEQYSKGWERSPWYIIPLLFMGLSLPPTFFLRYRDFDWRARFGPIRPVVLYFSAFLLAHMLISHKEERFMIPSLPLFLALLTPLVVYLIERRDAYRWRLWFFGIVNGVLLVLAVTSAPQRATIELAGYVDAHPDVRVITRVGGFTQIPTVFISHPVVLQDADVADVAVDDCSGVVVALALTPMGQALAADARFATVGRFQPGPLERALVAINPRHNARRGAVLVLRPVNCGNREEGNSVSGER